MAIDNSEQNMAAPTTQKVNTGSTKGTTKYVVIRDGYRVSDNEYESMDDPECMSEFKFWSDIAKRHSHGESVKIVVLTPSV